MSDSYYANKLASLDQLASTDKKTNLLEAFDKKIADLREYSAIKAQQDATVKAQAQGSWAGQLGLDPEEDPISHAMVNSLARFGSGSARLAGQGAVAVEDFFRNGLATNIPQSVRDARARQLNGEATEADLALLNAPYGFTEAPTYKHVTKEQFDRIHKDKGTNLSHIKKWEENQNELAATRAYHDVSSIVDRQGAQMANDQLAIDGAYASMDWQGAKKKAKEGDYFGAFNDALSAGGKLASSVAKVGKDNPAEVLGAVIENSPQLLAGGLLGIPGTVAAVGSYAIDEYNDAINDFRKKNNGAMPSEDWMRERGLGALGLAVSEGVSDRLTLGMGKLLKAGGSVAEKAVDGLAEGLKKSLASAALKTAESLPVRTTVGGLLDASGEYGTEALQTNIENAMRGKDTSFEETHQAGAMGAWAGGPMAAITSALEGKERVDTPSPAPKAISTANVDQLLNSKSSAYDLKTGLSALHKLSNAEDATEEQKAAYLAKAEDAVKTAEAHLNSLKDQTDGGRSAKEAKIAEYQALLDQVPDSEPRKKEILTALIESGKQDLQDSQKVNPDATKINQQIQKLEKQLESAKEVFALLTEEKATAQVKNVEVAPALMEANVSLDSNDPEVATKRATATEAVKKLSVLSMASPDAVSWQDAQALADNTTNALTPAQRTYFTAYAKSAKAIAELKTMQKVSDEVFNGDPALNQKGLLDYRNRVGQLLSVGNFEGANRELIGLARFMSSHKSKQEAFKQAWSEYSTTGKEAKVIKDVAGNWYVQSAGPKAKAQRTYVISAQSAKLVEHVRNEAFAIQQTMAALRAAANVAKELGTAPNITTTTANATSQANSVQQAPKVGVASTAQTVNPTEQKASDTTTEPAPWDDPATSDAGTASPDQPIQVTQAELDKAKQVAASSNEADYEQVDGRTAEIISALNDGRDVEVVKPGSKGVAPWDSGAVLQAMQEEYPNATFTQPNTEQAKAIEAVLSDIKSLLGDLYESPKNIFVHTDERRLGIKFYNTDSISLRADLFTDGITTGGVTDPLKAISLVLSHEMAHSADRRSGFFSQTNKDMQPGGRIYEEAKAVLLDKEHPFYKWIKNPVFGRDSAPHTPEVIASELYAQSFTLYALNKELFRETFPTAFAFVEQHSGQSRGVAEANTESGQGVGNTRADAGVGQEPQSQRSTPEAEIAQLSRSDGVVEEEPSAPATLDVLANAEEGSVLTKWLKQAGKAAETAGSRPLTAIKDFMSAWKQGKAFPQDFLRNSEVTPEQIKALDYIFATFFGDGKKPGWSHAIRSMVPTTINEAFSYEKTAQLLMSKNAEGRLDFEENIKAAMAVAAISWVNDAYGNRGGDHAKQINGFLNRDSDAPVSKEERKVIPQDSVRDSVAANSIGKTITKLLGLKATKEASNSFMPKLEATLGEYTLSLLKQQGLVTETAISDEVYQKLLGKASFNPRKQHYAITLNKPGTRTYPDSVVALTEAMKGSKGVLEKVFGVDPKTKPPTLEPVPYKAGKAKGSRTAVPAWLAEVLNKKSQEKNYVAQPMLKVVQSILGVDQSGLDTFLQIAGGEVIDQTTHARNVSRIEAQRMGLERELVGALGFVDELNQTESKLDTPFYLQYEPWNQQRVGIANNVFNPQSQKIARYLLTRDTWSTELDTSDPDSAVMQNFKLRVLDGLGVSTGKQANEVSLASWKSKVENNAVVQSAVNALMAAHQGQEMTTQQRQDVLAAVNEGGEAMHTLHVLSALAQLKAAEASGSKVKITLLGEVDGVTNGPMLSNLLLGAFSDPDSSFGFLNRGGFFEEGSGHTAYNVYRGQPGVRDLYEHIAGRILSQLNPSTWNTEAQRAMEAISSFTGNLGEMGVENGEVAKGGRNMVKRPITALHFGSSVFKAIDGMAEDFLDSIYSSIEKEAKKEDKNTPELIKRINAVLAFGDMSLSTSMPMEALLKREFTDKEERVLKDAFKAAFGEVTKNTLETEFYSLLARRDVMTETSNVAFGLYDTAYKVMKESYVGHLTSEDGTAELDAQGNLKWDLTSEQQAKLDRWTSPLEPVLQTAMSQREGTQGLRTGLSVAKVGEAQSDDPAYKAAIALHNASGTGPKTNTRTVNASGKIFKAPGVGMFSKSIHSTDSYISHQSVSETEALNNHDANTIGFMGVEDTARRLNEATWNALIQYSPAREMFNALNRTVLNLAALAKEGDVTEHLAPAIQGFLEATANKKAEKQPEHAGLYATPMDYLEAVVQNAFHTAFEADSIRLGIAAKTEVIDQYSMEGGAYTVPAESRAVAKQLLEKLSNELPKETKAALASLRVSFEGAASEKTDSLVEFETPTPLSELMGQPEVQVERTMRALASLTEVDQALRDMLNRVLDTKLDGTSLDDAFHATLTSNEQAAVVKALSDQLKDGVTTPVGRIGISRTESDKDLVAFFEANPKTTGREVLKKLKGILESRNDSRNAALNMILPLVYKAIGNVQVQYVTPQTIPSDILAMPDFASRGWYVKGGEVIYVLSPEFAASGLDPELMLHELTHAALESKLNEPPKSAKQKQARQELEDLLAKAKAVVQRKFPMDIEMKNAVSSLDELVAYGMFNQKFQSQVLRTISVAAPKGMIDGLRKFVSSVLALLGMETTSAKESEVDGLTALMVNAALLYKAQDEANVRQAKKRTNEVLSMASPGNQVDNYTTEDVFQALPAVGLDAGFNAKLQTRLQEIVGKLHGPFGMLKVQAERTLGNTPLDVWSHLQAAGQRPFAAKVLALGARLTQREAYVAEQIEATVRQALDDKAAANSQVYAQLVKVYQQAKEVLKGKIDADLYRAVFMPTKMANDKSDYLSVFVALALSSKEFNDALAFETHRPAMMVAGQTLTQRLESIWRGLSDWVGSRATGTYSGQLANFKIDSLISKLVQIESRKKGEIRLNSSVLNLLTPVDSATRTGIAVAKGAAKFVVDSKFVQNNKNGFIKAAGTASSLMVNDRVAAVASALNKMRDKTNELTHGEAMAMVNYIKGIPQWMNKLLIVGKQVEKNRLAVMTDTAKAVLHAFKDQGRNLTDKEKSAITAVVMRSGMFVLEKTFGVSGIQEMLEKSSVLDAAISKLEDQLKGYAEFEHYILQAKGLAYYRTTERVVVYQLMANAGNIARMFGTGKAVPAYADQAEAVLEKLIALYAMKQADQSQKDMVLSVMRSEANRGDKGNGIEMVLKMQAHLDQESRSNLFQGAEALRMHGYTSEILNPHTTFSVARNEQEAQALLDEGYVRMPNDIALDPADTGSGSAALFVLNGGGRVRRTSGAFSFTGMSAKGSSKHNNFYSPSSPKGVLNSQSMSSIYGYHTNAVQAQATNALTFDPTKVPGSVNLMMPLMNAQGQVTDYRYMMQAKTKDTLLERDNRFEHVMGTMAGSIYDKPASREQNKNVIRALREHYVKTVGDNPESFVLVHSTSPDPRMREVWNMLTTESKQDISKIWGANGMRVPKSMADVLFGYPKASLSDIYNKQDPNAVERLVMKEIATGLKLYAKMRLGMTAEQAETYSRRGAVTIRRAEAAWQDIVQVAKDFIVIKTGTVLWGNVMSNMGMLAMKGVPLVKGLKWQLTALRGAMDYERDRAALAHLKALQQAGYAPTDVALIQAQIVELEDAIARNPVKSLIDAGLMPTIVEDISTEDDPYSYKSHFNKWMDSKIGGLNPAIKNVGKWALMAHDTPIYRVMAKATQYSDFVARYALYKHLTENQAKPLSHDDAVFEASETFVNYDIPLPKHVQYLDDMGLAPFIKYFLSIQRVLARTLKDDPLRVLSTIAMGHFLGGLPMPTDSSFLTRIGHNPFDVGAFGLPKAVSETMAIQAGMALIK